MPRSREAAQRAARKTKLRGKQIVQHLQTPWRVEYLAEVKILRVHLNSEEPERERIKDTISKSASQLRNREMEGEIVLKYHIRRRSQGWEPVIKESQVKRR